MQWPIRTLSSPATEVRRPGNAFSRSGCLLLRGRHAQVHRARGRQRRLRTDLVIFNPGFPRRLRSREDVLAGGVAAAFSVKLTLDPAGLRDACERAARLRRATKTGHGSPRTELLGAFAVGVLAHAHTWTRPRSTPRENL
jgi:hypothetical protein